MDKNIMEDRIILFKLFLIKRNIYEKYIKAFKTVYVDSNFEYFLLTHVGECYSELVGFAFPWEVFIDDYDNWVKISMEWQSKSKLINNLLKK
ncbi:MAG: hypothetical protein VZR33_01370 [Methanosphaera sp.]|nr:hypothetical protein [Methanosphaera sp.]